MKWYQLILLVTCFIILAYLGIYAALVIPIKVRFRKIHKYCEEFGERAEAEGIDRLYRELSSEELLKEYTKLSDEAHQNMKNDKVFAEKGCRAKIVADILNERNIKIPD